MSKLRTRNGYLVHRNGLVVPSCNECPIIDPCCNFEGLGPTVFLGGNDKIQGSINANWSGTFPFSTGTFISDISISTHRVRVAWRQQPKIRVKLDMDIATIVDVISRGNRFYVGCKVEFREHWNNFSADAELLTGGFVDTFTPTFGIVPVWQRRSNPGYPPIPTIGATSIPTDMMLDFQISNVVTGSPFDTADLDRYSIGIDASTTSSSEYLRTETKTTTNVNIDCYSEFRVIFRCGGVSTTSPDPWNNMERDYEVDGSVAYEIEAIYP